MGKFDYIADGQMSLFDDGFIPQTPIIKDVAHGVLFRYLRYGAHTLVPEAAEQCREYLDSVSGVIPNDMDHVYNFEKGWDKPPCKNCEHFTEGCCQAGAHTCHIEYGKYLVCDAFKQTIDAKPKCQHSGHECNKQELWKVADSLDELQCPHVCCRMCNTVGCGARCNGSAEPKPKKEINCDECDVQFGSITCFERRGYMYDRVHREWIRNGAGNLLRSGIDKRECLKEFEDKSETEPLTSTEVTKKSCSNCLRFNMEIEQPPDGWGHIGYCAEHNSRTNDISYCQSWEPKPVEVVKYSTTEYAQAIKKHLVDHCRSWGMSEKIDQLRENKTAETFHKIFCKVTRTYYVDLHEWYFNVEFCKDNTVTIKRCGRDYNNRPLDATIQLQDVLNEF